MTPSQYETALLALATYRASISDDITEWLAIASVFRNRVLRYGLTYSEVLGKAEVNRPNFPSIKHPLLVNPQTGLLAQIDAIYKNEAPDYTSNHLFPDGALFFGRVTDHWNTGDFFDTVVLQHQDQHPLIGNFGAQAFYV